MKILKASEGVEYLGFNPKKGLHVFKIRDGEVLMIDRAKLVSEDGTRVYYYDDNGRRYPTLTTARRLASLE